MYDSIRGEEINVGSLKLVLQSSMIRNEFRFRVLRRKIDCNFLY